MRITKRIAGFLSAVGIMTAFLSVGVAAEGKTRVAKTLDFSDFPMTEVTTREIGAEASANMKFGVDGVPLLSARNGYEDAYAVWKLDAAEGETFDDCVFTFVGRSWYQDAAQKENNSMKVSVSTDNENYTLVKEYKSNDNADMEQKFVHDLTEYVKGKSTVYVRMDFLVFDSPHCMGLKSLSIVGNAEGTSEETDPPVTETPTTTEPTDDPDSSTAAPTTSAVTQSETKTTYTTAGIAGTVKPVEDNTDGLSAGVIAGIVVAVVVVLGGAGVAVFFMLRKKKTHQE